jgi:Ca2+-binding RTX toxin-like protein
VFLTGETNGTFANQSYELDETGAAKSEGTTLTEVPGVLSGVTGGGGVLPTTLTSKVNEFKGLVQVVPELSSDTSKTLILQDADKISEITKSLYASKVVVKTDDGQEKTVTPRTSFLKLTEDPTIDQIQVKFDSSRSGQSTDSLQLASPETQGQSPQKSASQAKNSSVTINYAAFDPDSEAKISLFYDTDGRGTDGILIADNLNETDGSGNYTWDVSNLPAGTYYIYAVIEDGENPPIYEYVQKPIEIEEAGAPEQVQGLEANWTSGTEIELEWEPVKDPDVAYYAIKYTSDAAGSEETEVITTNGPTSTVVIPNLTFGETYRFTVEAVDQDENNSKESEAEIATVGSEPTVELAEGEWEEKAEPGKTYTAQIIKENEDDTLTLLEAPPGATLDADGKLTWQVPENASGWYKIRIESTDYYGQTEVLSYELLAEKDDNLTAANQRTLQGSGGDDRLVSGPGNSFLNGDKDNDFITSSTGDDTLAGGSGDDTLSGGAGNDTLSGGSGSDAANSDSGSDFALGNTGDDTLTGGSDSDALYGGKENDLVDGGEGDDTLLGELGDDSLSGGDGNDTLTSGQGNDWLDSGTGNDLAFGQAGADIIKGDVGEDSLYGNDGDDEVSGGTGNDSLFGEGDFDALNGGEGNDFLSGGEGSDSLAGGADNDSLTGGAGDDSTTGGRGNDLVVGDSGSDSLIGGMGSDKLFGDEGSDSLIGAEALADNPGRGEVDTLTGGAGYDIFVLGEANQPFYDSGNSANQGLGDYALIVDFKASEDLIVLSGFESEYVLKASPTGLPTGTAIFRSSNLATELIAVVQGEEPLSLANVAFSFV